MVNSKLKLLFLFLVILIVSCEEPAQIKPTEVEFVTANVIQEVKSGCEYSDGTICIEKCCNFGFDESCDGPIFKECSIEANEWGNIIFSDSNCKSRCDEKENIKLEKIATEEDKQKTKEMLDGFMGISEEAMECTEGWVCANSSWRGFQSKSCDILTAMECEAGCSNSKCNELCEIGSKRCKGTRLQECNGVEWDTLEFCKDGCEDEKCVGETENVSNSTNSNQIQSLISSIKSCSKDCIELIPEESNFNGSVSCPTSTFGEYLALENVCSEDCSITGWNLSDETGNDFILGFNVTQGSKFKIITGRSPNTATDLFLDRCSALWNNGGDIVYLRNIEKEIVVEYTYP